MQIAAAVDRLTFNKNESCVARPLLIHLDE